MHSPPLDHVMEKILPVVDLSGSDSAMLDNALEFLLYSGMDLPKAVMLTIPEPWSQNRDMPRAIQDMYHYYATMMEPWDGPAAILFSDGDVVGACLDRNGLRPIRYYLTDDGTVILASEVGVLDLPPEKIVRKSRLGPGKMLLLDTRTGQVREDCDEGVLEWIHKDRLAALPQWAGDRIFLDLLRQGAPFFSLKLRYQGETLVYACLNGKELIL